MGKATYEQILRDAAEKQLNIRIPTIPGNINPDQEIIFLERILHINAAGELEQAIFKKYRGQLK